MADITMSIHTVHAKMFVLSIFYDVIKKRLPKTEAEKIERPME